MKKQKCYLPNLNTVIMHNRQYQKHLSRLHHAKSQYKIINTKKSPTQKSQRPEDSDHKLPKTIQTDRTFQQLHKKRPIIQSPKQQTKANLMQISNLVQLKSKLNNLKFKFKDREGKRHQQYFNMRYKQHQQIKQRISKFINQGSKIRYKYKRSLVYIERRRKEKEYSLTKRSNQMLGMDKAELEELMKQPLKKYYKSAKNHSQIQDIFYTGMNSKGHHLETIPSEISQKLVKKENPIINLNHTGKTPHIKIKTQGTQLENRSQIFEKRINNRKKSSFNHIKDTKNIKMQDNESSRLSKGQYNNKINMNNKSKQLQQILIKKKSKGSKQKMQGLHIIEVYSLK